MIYFSPIFDQILLIYLSWDIFLPLFFKFPVLRAHFLRWKKFEGQNRGVRKISKNLNFIYQSWSQNNFFIQRSSFHISHISYSYNTFLFECYSNFYVYVACWHLYDYPYLAGPDTVKRRHYIEYLRLLKNRKRGLNS